MKIGILGAGLMGSALGLAWARSGHQIYFSYSRDTSKLEQLAAQAGNGARVAPLAEAVSRTDVLLMAIPWHRLDDLLEQCGTLTDRIVISCMLPMTADDSALALGFNSSGAETLAQRTGAQVIGTFNTVWSEVIARRAEHADPLSMFYVGDAARAKTVAETLIKDAGFEPVDAGELANARLLEPFGLLMGQMGFAIDPMVAYRFVKPEQGGRS